MRRLLLLAILVAVVAYFSCNCCHKKIDLFTYPADTIWGKSQPDTAIKPFSVKIDPNDIEDLKQRLARWRRHEHLDGVGSSYGISGNSMDKLVQYWRENYDFSKFESKLNTLPQFTTVIQGLKVHFLHVKADTKATKRIPLLLVHGWPGSVVEFYRTIPLLTSVGDDGVAFDVIAPSIPGFAFSEAAAKPGFNPIAVAQTFHSLMKRLGYDKYVVQGGDWGSIICGLMARMYPDDIVGYHTNFATIPTSSLTSKVRLAAAIVAPKLFLNDDELVKFYKMTPSKLLEATGYFHEQGTKPDTLGVALTDSPAGFAAWIVEKFELVAENAECKGDAPGKGISNDDLLTNIMVYWLTNHVTSAGRIYKEFVQGYYEIDKWLAQPIVIPSAVACYPMEIACSPKVMLSDSFPRLVHYTNVEHGGHFAAMEEPVLFAKDVRAGVKAIYDAHEEKP